MANPYTLPPDNLTDNGNALVNLLVWEAQNVNGLFVSFLFLLFLAIWIVGFKVDESRRGRSNAIMWMAVSALIVTGIEFIAFLIPGLINIEVLGISLALTIGAAVLFFLTKDR